MKFFNIFLLFFLFVLVFNQNCNFDVENEVNKHPLIISQRKKNKNFNEFHNLIIHYDFTTFDIQKNIPNSYKKKVKKILVKVSNALNNLLVIKNKNIISTRFKINEICSEEIANYDEKIHKGFLADLVIYPIFEDMKKNIFIKSFVCAISKKTKRTIIAFLELSTKFNFNKINSKNFYFNIVLHQMFHLLGFNKNQFKYYEKISKSQEPFEINHHKNKTKFYLKSKNVENSFKKFNFKGELTQFRNSSNSHWKNVNHINDIMIAKNFYNTEITELTLNALLDTKYLFVNRCILFKLYNKCYNLNQKCLPNFVKDILITNYVFDYKKNKFFCYVLDKNNKKCVSNLGEIISDNITKFTLNYEKLPEEYVNVNERIELYNKTEQKISLLNPSKNCPKKHPRTVFFYYNETLIKNDWEKLSKLNIENITIKNKNYFVTYKGFGNQYNTKSVIGPLSYNNLIRSRKRLDNNLIMEYCGSEERDKFIQSLKKYQKFDIFPMNGEITRKSSLYLNYKIFKENFPNDFDYMPESFVMPKDKKIIEKKFKNYKIDANDLWIVKPKYLSRGRGIHLFDNLKDDINNDVLISKYISNPHTVNGKKYDLRLYVFVNSFSPLKIYLFNEGIARISSEEFSIDLKNIKNLFVHLTNTSINKKNPKYKRVSDLDDENGNDWSLLTLKKYIKNNNKIDFDKEILPKIKDIIIKIFLTTYDKALKSMKSKHIRNNALYQLFGIDIILDDTFKPWLLEVNYGPDLSNIDLTDLKLKTKVVTDLFNIIGIVPFKKGENDNQPLDEVFEYDNLVDEYVDDALCEFDRPKGGYELIFPRKDNINYYSKFIEADEVNKKLWEILKNKT